MEWIVESGLFRRIDRDTVSDDKSDGFLPLKHVDDSLGCGETCALAGLDRLTGQVGGDPDVVEVPQRVVRSHRFGPEDVEGGAGDLFLSESTHEGHLVDE